MNTKQKNFLSLNALFIFGLLLGFLAQNILQVFIYAGVFLWALIALKMMRVIG